jgi:ADP-ribose pyrophosphatase YjhB (NUDIX family)
VTRARFCLQCGGRLRAVRERGKLRRRCGRCGWTFYGNPVPAAIAVIRRGRHILLTRRAVPPFAGTWDLPGGFLEAGERPDEALRRELREELGVTVRDARLLLFETDVYGPSGVPVLAAAYEARLSPGRLRPGDDVSEARWFAEDAIPYRAIGFPSIRRSLRAYVRRRLRPSSR